MTETYTGVRATRETTTSTYMRRPDRASIPRNPGGIPSAGACPAGRSYQERPVRHAGRSRSAGQA
jgi:hypothetical protein